MSLIVLALLAGAPVLQTMQQAAADPTRPRVRPVDDMAGHIVADGARRSLTVAALLDDLERHDVVVYVGTDLNLRRRGTLTFVAHAGSLTYLFVRLDPKHTANDRVAALAHELTHAMEVAGAPAPVRSEQDLAALYRVIGRAEGNGDFESVMAEANERLAQAELSTASTRPGRQEEEEPSPREGRP